MASATTIYDFTPIDSENSTNRPHYFFKLYLRIFPTSGKKQDYPLSALKGKVVLVVNTASECGFKGQLKGLEDLYKSVNASHPDSFVVLGFPSNHFNQEPKLGEKVHEHCELNFGVSFPLLGEIGLNGQKMKPKPGQVETEPKVDGGEALFEWLGEKKPGIFGVKKIKWNFEKFLIGKDGKVKQRYSTIATPSGLKSDVLAEVKA